MMTMSARINAISTHLLAIARPHAEDTNDAYRLAHVALLRIMHKDPDLAHFQQIMDALKRQRALH
jgi:hypothetical protein